MCDLKLEDLDAGIGKLVVKHGKLGGMHIEETGEHFELRGEVASQDVSADLSREERGMGIRFVNLSEEQRKQVSDLYEHSLKKALEGD